MFDIKEIKEKTVWENFISSVEPHTFLHSWEWGEFNNVTGEKVWRFGVYNHSELMALALVIKINAKRGSFLLVPHGPIIMKNELGIKNKELILKTLTERLKQLGKQEKCDFIRIAPILPDTEENMSAFKQTGFRNAAIHVHAELVWILDLTKSEQDLLKGMRKTTRHETRKAERVGVKISKSKNPLDIEKFYKLYEKTVNRKHFTPFSKEYLQKEFEIFSVSGKAELYFAEYDGETISGAIIIYSNGGAFYHHGASSLKHAQIPASHLLQWQIIKDAADRGLKYYNFWGIAPQSAKNHPWAGLTLFKTGFGGKAEKYVPTQDLKITPKYYLNYAIEVFRKLKRGL